MAVEVSVVLADGMAVSAVRNAEDGARTAAPSHRLGVALQQHTDADVALLAADDSRATEAGMADDEPHREVLLQERRHPRYALRHGSVGNREEFFELTN